MRSAQLTEPSHINVIAWTDMQAGMKTAVLHLCNIDACCLQSCRERDSHCLFSHGNVNVLSAVQRSHDPPSRVLVQALVRDS